MMKRCFLLFSLFLLMFLPIPSSRHANAKPLPAKSLQAGQGPLLCITSPVNTTVFPNITFNFRMLDANLSPIVPADTELHFSENGQTIVHLADSIQRDATGVGIDYYFIVDRGNRTPQSSVRSILQTFVSSGYYNEQTDKVKIYTNEKDNSYLYYPSSINGNTLTEAIANYPLNGDNQYRQVYQSFDQVLSELEVTPNVCQNMRIIIMLMGDDALSKNDIFSFAQRTKDSLAKLAIFHVYGQMGGSFASRSTYSDLATLSGGTYRQIKSLDNDVKPGFDNFMLYKQVFTATYRTNFGGTGSHNIALTYQNANIPVLGQSSYSVDVRPPTVSLTGDTVINRAAQNKTAAGDYIYNIGSLPYVAKIVWGDSYPRIIKSAALIVKEGETENETVIPLSARGDNSYELNWNFSPIKAPGLHTLYLSVKITDEFDYQAVSAPFEILLTNNTEAVDKVPIWVPTTLSVLASVIVILLILMIFMWNRMLNFAKQGGTALGKIAGDIRKTIVGGGKRGKPLASLEVLEGPPNMIGQELKIYTESVRLGRNPQLADMSFYGPNVTTSVSGLHARLEKMSGRWRIVALSQSGSETFINDQPIPFNEPVWLQNNQKVRMGYFAQQPVILIFHTEQIEHKTWVDSAGYDLEAPEVKMDMDETIESSVFFSRTNNNTRAMKKPSSKNSDSAFDEFR